MGSSRTRKKERAARSRKILDQFHEMWCVVQSEKCIYQPCTADHWKTRGAGGNDELENLNPMCFFCHLLKGTMGVKSFWRKYGKRIQENRIKQGLPEQLEVLSD